MNDTEQEDLLRTTNQMEMNAFQESACLTQSLHHSTFSRSHMQPALCMIMHAKGLCGTDGKYYYCFAFVFLFLFKAPCWFPLCSGVLQTAEPSRAEMEFPLSCALGTLVQRKSPQEILNCLNLEVRREQAKQMTTEK